MPSDKAKAIKLAKELHANIDNTKLNWKELRIELTQEKKYNELTDDFKRKKAKIFAQRNFKKVIKDVKNHQRNTIELIIPVEKTDPPTVDRLNVANQIGDINFFNYHVSFSTTGMQQTLDETGNLVSEKEVVSATEPIKHSMFLKKFEKRTAGALTGFFNNYMRKLAKSLFWVKQVNLFLTKNVRNPVALTPNFDGMLMNCFIKVVDTALKNRKDYKSDLRPRIREINQQYFNSGVTEEAIDLCCKKLKINIHVVSVLQKTWYHKHSGDSRLTVLVCSHNGHATVYRDTKDMTDFLNPKKNAKSKVTYVDGLFDLFLSDPSPIKFPVVIKDQIVAFYTYDGDLFKNRDIFFDEQDFIKNQKNEDLFGTFTLTSRYYKMLKMKYGLQDMFSNEDLYHFVKSADQYTPPWCTDLKYAEKGQAFDQDRAYMFYEKSKWYDHYQFPRMPTHFYKNSEQSRQDELLKLTGFAQVNNVFIPNHLTFLVETRFIQDEGIYSTMRLAWLKEKGATFDIIKIAWSNDKQKLDFHITLTEHQSCNLNLSKKQEECSLMGRLIPNQSSTFTSMVHCQDANEFLQLQYQLGSKVLKVDHENKIIYFYKDQEKILRGAYHVHAYILDYQQMEFAEKALSVPFENILKVKVDCIVLNRNPTLKSIANNIVKKANGKIAFDEIMKMLDDENITVNAKAFAGWHDAVIKADDAPSKWAGFHEEISIKNATTALISEVDFTHRRFISNIQLSEIPYLAALNKYNEITGAAGCGKTYKATHYNLWDYCILVPTNALRVKFHKENPTIPCMTYHMAFDTNKKKGAWVQDRHAYANYIIDECSMICKGVMDNILTHKNAMNANIILIHDRAQLAPVMPGNEDWTNPRDRYFTNAAEYKKRTWNQIYLTEQKRQTDPHFIKILTQMRTLHDQPGRGLLQMIELLKERIIPEKDVAALYQFDTEDVLIASTNVEVNRWNEILSKSAQPGELKLKYNKTKGDHVNNERVILQSEIGKDMELAFAATIHIVQGITFHDRLFISLSLLQKNNNFDNHLLYTAVSRVKSIDQLWLVKV